MILAQLSGGAVAHYSARRSPLAKPIVRVGAATELLADHKGASSGHDLQLTVRDTAGGPSVAVIKGCTPAD